MKTKRLKLLTFFLLILGTPGCRSIDPAPTEGLEKTVRLHHNRFGSLEKDLSRLQSSSSGLALRLENAEGKTARLELSTTRQQVELSLLTRKYKALQQTHRAWSRHSIQQQLLALEADQQILNAKRERLEKDLRNLPPLATDKEAPLVSVR
jgi:predicted  nucleic acid-binding Zn-ribbon protein